MNQVGCGVFGLVFKLCRSCIEGGGLAPAVILAPALAFMLSVHGSPVLLGADQEIIEFLQLRLVVVAARMPKVAKTGIDHIVHVLEHIDPAFQFFGRVKHQGQRIDIPGVHRRVYGKVGGAPLLGY